MFRMVRLHFHISIFNKPTNEMDKKKIEGKIAARRIYTTEKRDVYKNRKLLQQKQGINIQNTNSLTQIFKTIISEC